MKKNIVLIGAADSIGVPYSKDNYDNKGFFEMIEQHLSSNYNVVTINCFHMSTNNDNRYINHIISNKTSLLDIKKSQNMMLKKCKYSGIYPYLEMPKSFLNHYKINVEDENIIVNECIKNNDTIFIYSAFVNDLLKSRKLSLFKLLKPGRIKKELKEINVDFVFGDLERNIKKLIDINNSIKIYIVGWFIPTKIKYIRKNLTEFIFNVNDSLRNISKKYSSNTIFINNDNLSTDDFNNIDFHPNKKGHEKIYRNFIDVYERQKDSK